MDKDISGSLLESSLGFSDFSYFADRIDSPIDIMSSDSEYSGSNGRFFKVDIGGITTNLK